MNKKRFEESKDIAAYMLDKVAKESRLLTVGYIGDDAFVIEGEEDYFPITHEDQETAAKGSLIGCVVKKAGAVVLAQYHADGDAFPTEDDIKVTKAIKKAMYENSKYLLDHVIITDTQYFSFADEKVHELSELSR